MQINKTAYIFSLFLTISQILNGVGTPVYAVKDIPAGLTENAGAIFRISENKITVNSPNSMTIRKKEAITILRESGVRNSVLDVGYNKLIRVGSISGTIYDENGVKVRTIKADEINDYSAYDGFSLYSDARVKHIDPKYYNYPFTIEYQYETFYKTALYMPSFYIFMGSEISVENASYEMNIPVGSRVHYLEFNNMPAHLDLSTGKNTIYKWQYKNFPAKKREPYSAQPAEQYPFVLVAPDEFEIEGFSGRMDSWNSLGIFFNSLNNGKQKLPESTVQKIKELTSVCRSTEEKIMKIYDYSQKKNRYVSIQEGIGGLEPFDAMTVDNSSYGDCKALANYVKALLASAGITSHYTLVNAGTSIEPVFKEFISDYFNHVIICVPNEGDTIWLECTNSHTPVNYLGSFTDDRYVLIVTDKGGNLIRTPFYDHTGNSKLVSTHVYLKPDGKALVSQKGYFSGTSFLEEFSYTLLDEKDRNKALLKSLSSADLIIKNYDFKINPESPRCITKTLEIQANNCAVLNGDLMLLRQNPINLSQTVPPYARKRETSVYIERNELRTDSTFIHIPDGYTLKGIPENVRFENEMASCSFEYFNTKDKIIMVRNFRLNRGTYKADQFNILHELLARTASKDDEKVVLSKKP